jgi:hypothetical protein
LNDKLNTTWHIIIPISLAPGFSPVVDAEPEFNRFSGFEVRDRKPLKRLENSM